MNRPFLSLVLFQSMFLPSFGFALDKDVPFQVQQYKGNIRPQDVIHWEAVGATPDTSKTSIEIGLRLSTLSNFAVYKHTLRFSGSNGFVPVNISYPTSRKIVDPISEQLTEVFYSGEFLVTFSSLKRLETDSIEISLEYTGCTEIICLFPHLQKFVVALGSIDPSTARETQARMRVETKDDESTNSRPPRSNANPENRSSLQAIWQRIMSMFGMKTETAALVWMKTEESAFEVSKKRNLPILVDGWAEWCMACIEMEQSTFSDPLVVQELSANWVLLKLDLTESNAVNDRLIEKYRFEGLPSYALMKPGGSLDGAVVVAGKLGPQEFLAHLDRFLKVR